MSLIDFASNHYDDLIAAGGLIVGLIWHRGKQVKLSDLWDTMLKIGAQLLPRLLADPNLHDDAYVRAKINGFIWAGLERLGQKHSPALDKLVDEAVEHIHGDLAAKLTDELLSRYINVSDHTALVLKQAQASP
jgi:hypothetical protein